MIGNAARFIDEMTGLSPGLRAACDEAARSWAPESAPAAILLLALGHRLVDDLEVMGPEASRPVFDALEHALTEGDADSQSAAADMIEAVVGRAVDLETWPETRLLLRDRSAAHALTCIALDR